MRATDWKFRIKNFNHLPFMIYFFDLTSEK